MISKENLLHQILQMLTGTINISKQELKAIKKRIVISRIPQKTLLLQSGEHNTGFYMILTGLVRTYKIVDHKQYTIDIIGSGGFVGYFNSDLEETLSTYNIEVIEKSSVIFLSFVDLNWFEENVEEGKKMVRTIYGQNLAFATQKYISILNPDPLKRLEELITRIPDIDQRVPQKMVATYLNITPAYYSLLKSNMK